MLVIENQPRDTPGEENLKCFGPVDPNTTNQRPPTDTAKRRFTPTQNGDVQKVMTTDVPTKWRHFPLRRCAVSELISMHPAIFTSVACWRAGKSGAGIGWFRGTKHAPQYGVLHVTGAVRHDPAGEPAGDRPEKQL